MSKQKRALVVDDSKSARLVLRRMLEKHDLAVDTVESAGQALDFLIHHRPDVIFMDHMMPGMDGFEAVKAIKNNPQTATIPVMMYTSKGGDLYLGQARALGAVGVLPKTVAPAELFESLRKIGLVKERRSEPRTLDEEDASERAEDIKTRSISPPPGAPFMEPGMQDSAKSLNAAQLDTHLRSLLEEQRVEIRKDMLLSMDTVSQQTNNRLNKELDEKLDAFKQQLPPVQTPSMVPTIALAGLLLVSLIWNFSMHRQHEQATSAVSAGNDVEASSQQEAEQTISKLEALQAETVALLSKSWQLTSWAINQELLYPYDEIALDGARADMVEQLLTRLFETGYTGKVILHTHAGEFCLLGDQETGFRLPPPDITVDQCEFIGNPVQAADLPAAHQSLSFANFVNSTPLLNEGQLTMEVVAASRADPLYAYPDKPEGPTAQVWNEVAAKNNRVVIILEP
jgi:CheY-like chemotaxis protein